MSKSSHCILYITILSVNYTSINLGKIIESLKQCLPSSCVASDKEPASSLCIGESSHSFLSSDQLKILSSLYFQCYEIYLAVPLMWCFCWHHFLGTTSSFLSEPLSLMCRYDVPSLSSPGCIVRASGTANRPLLALGSCLFLLLALCLFLLRSLPLQFLCHLEILPLLFLLFFWIRGHPNWWREE